MSRDLTASVLTEIAKNQTRVAIFVEVEFVSGTTRIWSGYGDKLLGGNTFNGVGNLLGMAPVEETEDIKAINVSLSLSGIPSAFLSLALSDSRQGKTATIWFVFLDSDGAIISDEFILFRGRTDVPTISEGAETAIFTLAVENHLIQLDRASNIKYTNEDQLLVDATDIFFEFVPSLQEKDIIWGPNG